MDERIKMGGDIIKREILPKDRNYRKLWRANIYDNMNVDNI